MPSTHFGVPEVTIKEKIKNYHEKISRGDARRVSDTLAGDSFSLIKLRIFKKTIYI